MQRDRAADRLLLGRDHRRDLAPLEPAEDLRVGVSGGGGHDLEGGSGRLCRRVEPLQDRLTFGDLAGCDLDVEDDAALIVDGAMLLVARLETLPPAARRHAGVRIGDADLLELAGLARFARGLGFVVFGGRGRDVSLSQALPADVGPDQRGVDVNHLALGKAGLHPVPNRALEDAAEPFGAPPLADARQRGRVRQPLVQAVPGANQRIARLTCASRIRRRSCTTPSRNPASLSRTAASGSIPGRPTPSA